MRSNTGFMDGCYCLPAGHVEDMESFSVATARETLEEVGVIVQPAKLKHLHTMHRLATDRTHVRVDVFFEAEDWEGTPVNKEPDKHSEIAWLEIDNLPTNVMDYIVYALNQISLGETYSEYGW
jgi:8-oxo-dGTP diphosphatase